MYDGRKRLAKRLKKYKEYRRNMLGEVLVITNYWNTDAPPDIEDEGSWIFKIYIWNQRDPEIVNLTTAKVRYRRAFAWYAMENKWPKKFPSVWEWVASYNECPLPMRDEFRD